MTQPLLTSELVGDVPKVFLCLVLLYQQQLNFALDAAEPLNLTWCLDLCSHHTHDRVLKQLHSTGPLQE